MNNKIPCGGFYLSDTLGVDESGKLGVNGGEPYKSLATDGDGGVKWEDRLAYDDSRVVVELPNGTQYVKVADEIPSWASVDAPMKVWTSDGISSTTNPPEDYSDLGSGSFYCVEAAFIATDNFEASDNEVTLTFPKKGIYFFNVPAGWHVTGIASADSDTPEIVWDGNVEFTKTIDPKYIPSELNEIVLPSSTSGSSKKFKIAVDDTGAISATEVTT